MADPVANLNAALEGRYRIRRELGRGGTATVYLADDLKHGRAVAIKVLRPELTAAVRPERFRREITLTARLNHPHILPLLDSGEADGFLYYVMPVVDGETLAARLARTRTLTIPETLDVALDVAAALDHAHAHGVTHRDIKPANIFVTDGEALVADFGIASVSEWTEGSESLTGPGLRLGTPRYMSPEQLTEPERVDWRTDVFSFGLVIFQCITGRLPFGRARPGSHPLGWIARDPGALGEGCPGVLEEFVFRCLKLDPTERLPEGSTLGEVCHAVVKEVNRKQAAAEQDRNRRIAVGVAGVVATALALVVVALFVFEPVGRTPMVEVNEPVVTSPSRNTEARLIPPGREMSFLSDRAGPLNVWIVPVEGGTERQITHQQAGVRSHVWSPDGSRLAFVVGSPGRFLRIQDRDGGNVQIEALPEGRLDPTLLQWWGHTVYMLLEGRLWSYDVDRRSVRLRSGAGADYRYVDVHPDQQRIVYAREGDLWVSHLDGSQPHRLTDDPWSQRFPCWMGHEGDELAYLSNRGGQMDVWRAHASEGLAGATMVGSGGAEALTCAADGRTLLVERTQLRANLWVLAPDGTRSRLTADSRADMMPSVSADGRLVFQRTRRRLDAVGDPLFDASVLVSSLEPEGLGPERVLADEGFAPEISPSGRWVSFLRTAQGPRASLSELALFVTDLDGNARLVTDRFPTPAYRFQPPIDWDTESEAWSPDGSTLYYIEETGDETHRIARASPGPGGIDSETVLAFDSTSTPLDLSVSPDGTRVSYVVHRASEGAYELHSIATEGGDERTLLRETSADVLYNAGWTPEGLAVAVRWYTARGAQPMIIERDATVDELPLLQDGLGSQATIWPTSRVLLMPVLGSSPGLYRLPLDRRDAEWEVVLQGFSYSAVETGPDRRLFYARHELNSDLWRIVFASSEEP